MTWRALPGVDTITGIEAEAAQMAVYQTTLGAEEAETFSPPLGGSMVDAAAELKAEGISTGSCVLPFGAFVCLISGGHGPV